MRQEFRWVYGRQESTKQDVSSGKESERLERWRGEVRIAEKGEVLRRRVSVQKRGRRTAKNKTAPGVIRGAKSTGEAPRREEEETMDTAAVQCCAD